MRALCRPRSSPPVGVWLLALALGIACGACKKKPDGVATLLELDGSVTLIAAADKQAVTAQVASPLQVGDTLITAEDSHAKIQFALGHHLFLGPKSKLVIYPEGPSVTPLGAELVEGLARVRAEDASPEMDIATPPGRVRVGGVASDVAISTKHGIRILAGAARIVKKGGGDIKVGVGQIYVADRVQEAPPLPSGEPTLSDALFNAIDQALSTAPPPVTEEGTTVRLKPMQLTITKGAATAEVLRAGTTGWEKASGKPQVFTGDVVRSGAKAVSVKVGKLGELTLHAQTELAVDAANTSDDAEEAAYTLRRGRAALTLRKGEGVKVRHRVRVSDQVFDVDPGNDRADVEISRGNSGAGAVVVRLGKVKVAGGDTLDPGTSVAFEPGKPVGVAIPLASTRVRLEPGGVAQVNLTGPLQPVEFAWAKGREGGPYVLELARDSKFKKIVFRQELTRPSFVTDRLELGGYYWRVRSGGKWLDGRVSVQREPASGCTRCKRENVVEEKSDKTVIFFQQTVPAITLSWQPVRGASRYRVLVYHTNDLARPLVDQRTSTTTLKIPAGVLGEGINYWHAEGLGDGDAVLLAKPVSQLELRFDNTVASLVIETPAEGARLAGESVNTAGIVRPGASLSIDGQTVKQNDAGRFSFPLALQKGANRVTYLVTQPDGSNRFYFRTVYRD